MPTLHEATGGIRVNEIVTRVKCELAASFVDKDRWLPKQHKFAWLPDDRRFAWLSTWVTQADLTLEVTDQATFAPGATITQPLRNGFAAVGGPSTILTTGALGTSISAVTQSFAVAGGGSYNGQSERTQTLSFSISMDELKEWRNTEFAEGACRVSDHADLRGRLGLREWVQDALSPIGRTDDEALLHAGFHPKSGQLSQASPPTTKPKAKPAQFTIALETEIPCSAELKASAGKVVKKSEPDIQKSNTFSGLVNGILSNIDETEKKDNTTLAAVALQIGQKSIYEPILDPGILAKRKEIKAALANVQTFEEVLNKKIAQTKASLKELGDISTQATDNISKIKSSIASDKCVEKNLKNYVSVLSSNIENINEFNSSIKVDARTAQADMKNLDDFINAANGFLQRPIDPPINSIGQSVQFILDTSANVTPNWTFVRFKGPNSPLFSAERMRTHLLNITIGPSTDIKNVSTAVSQNNFYLQLNAALKNPTR